MALLLDGSAQLSPLWRGAEILDLLRTEDYWEKYVRSGARSDLLVGFTAMLVNEKPWSWLNMDIKCPE